MRVVIDIPERVYTYLTKECSGLVDDGSDSILLHLAKGVIQGTVLPKGHGDLIDRDNAVSEINKKQVVGRFNTVETLNNMPIVVSADKGE